MANYTYTQGETYDLCRPLPMPKCDIFHILPCKSRIRGGPVGTSKAHDIVRDSPISLVSPVQQTPEQVTQEAVVSLGGDVLALGVRHVALDVGVLLVQPAESQLAPATQIL